MREKAHYFLDKIVEEPMIAMRFGENLFETLEKYSCTGKYLSTLSKLSQTIDEPTLSFYIHQKYADVIRNSSNCTACKLRYLGGGLDETL